MLMQLNEYESSKILCNTDWNESKKMLMQLNENESTNMLWSWMKMIAKKCYAIDYKWRH